MAGSISFIYYPHRVSFIDLGLPIALARISPYSRFVTRFTQKNHVFRTVAIVNTMPEARGGILKNKHLFLTFLHKYSLVEFNVEALQGNWPALNATRVTP